jgi:hypothetical protein
MELIEVVLKIRSSMIERVKGVPKTEVDLSTTLALSEKFSKAEIREILSRGAK